MGIAFKHVARLAVTALPAAPRVDVSLSYAEFSPDGDGFQDYVWINVRSSESPLYTSDWVLTIRDSDGTIVRQINADRRKIRPSRGVGNLFLPGKYDLQSPVLPSRRRPPVPPEAPMSVRIKDAYATSLPAASLQLTPRKGTCFVGQ